MPCVSVSNNRDRKATVKAARIERKNNRKNTRLAKKQQSEAARIAKQQQAASVAAAKTQQLADAKTAKQQFRASKKAAKTRQSLEKRVTKKHQAHRAKSKAARAKTLKTEAKLAARTAKSAAKIAKIEAKSQAKATTKATKSAARTARVQKLKTSAKNLKTSVQKPVKALKSSLETAKKARKSRQAAAKAAKSAAKSPKETVNTQKAEAARTAKISGAGVQTSFKINHNPIASKTVNSHNTTTRTVNNPLAALKNRTPIYTPEPDIRPLRRTAFMTRDDLINAESRLGSTIFGPVPAGHRREFFHDQANIWIWFESWHDEADRPHQLTVRYEVRTSGVYKKVSAGSYFKLAGDELENFRRATHAYLHLVKKYLYPHIAPAK